MNTNSKEATLSFLFLSLISGGQLLKKRIFSCRNTNFPLRVDLSLEFVVQENQQEVIKVASIWEKNVRKYDSIVYFKICFSCLVCDIVLAILFGMILKILSD